MSAASGALGPAEAAPTGWGVWLAAFAGVLVLCDAFDATLYALVPDVPGATALPLSRAPLLVVFAAAGYLLAGEPRVAAQHLRAAWILWPAVVLAFVSGLWSDQPSTTIAWATALLGTTAFGLGLSVRFSALAQARLAAAASASIALGSVLAGIVAPSFAREPSGLWHGVYVHRNLFGRVMALGVVAAIVCYVQQRRRTLPTLALFACGAMLLASGSRASWLATASAASSVLLLLGARRKRERAGLILFGGAAAAALSMLLLLTTPTGLGLLARTATFSDRTLIWWRVGTEVLNRPWLGHGYAAFWPGPAGTTTLHRLRMSINHAHDGGLDVAAELGVLGLVLVFAPMATFAIGAFRHALEHRDPPCLWPAAYIAFFFAANVGESSLLRHKIYWALYVAAACHVAVVQRRRAAPAPTELDRE